MNITSSKATQIPKLPKMHFDKCTIHCKNKSYGGAFFLDNGLFSQLSIHLQNLLNPFWVHRVAGVYLSHCWVKAESTVNMSVGHRATHTHAHGHRSNLQSPSKQ